MTKRVDRMGLLIGGAIGVAVTTIVLNFAGGEGWIRETWPFPRWTFAVPIVALVAAAAVWAVRSRSPWIATLAVALGVLGTGTGVLRIGNADPMWARVLQGIGLAMLLALVLAAVLWYARAYTELERFLFTESTSVAFFVTIVGAGVYGAFEAFTETPDVPFLLVPVFGLASWGLSALLFHRRYS